MKWKKRALFVLCIIVLISAAIAVCMFSIPSLRKKLEKREKPYNYAGPPAEQYISGRICASEDCVITAAKILKYMNTKADPCEDFYNFSCGKFLSSYSIPEGWNSFGTKDIHKEELDVTVKSVLEQAPTKNQSDSLNKAQTVYKTCINLSRIDEYGVNDLKDVLSNAGVGDWPFLNSHWKDCRLDIEWRMAKLNSMGLDSLFHLETKFGGDDHRLFAVLSPAEPLVDGICDDDPDNVSIALERASEHREILTSVLELLGVTITNITEQDIDDIFEFDFLFCNATKESRIKAPVEDAELLNMTLIHLADMAPQINWMRWRNIVFSELRLSFPHDKQHIYIDGLESAILKINDILHKTTSKVQANYLTWRFVFQHLGYLGKDFRRLIESHSRIVVLKLGNLQMSSDRWIPRWRQCVIFVKNLMPLSMLLEYGDHINMRAREKEMDSVTSLVTDEFKLIMKDAKDLKKTDQMRSSHKIGLIQFLLTYPYKDKKFFHKFYSDLGAISDSFLKNGLKLRLIRMRKLLEGVSRSKTIYDMEYTVQTIYSTFGSEMYSFFRGNQIVISLGALQSCPINSKTIPKFMTLSTFGWKIGHELAHGFDLLALDGATGYNWTWWPLSVSVYAKARADCYLKFYTNKRDLTVDEALKSTTLNEDLCDNQGLLLAHRAYLRYLSQPYDDQLLPGLPLTSKELFFVSYAQQFCELRRSPNKEFTAPGRRRVNQVLQNYAPFSTTFNCGRDKPMNPPKCGSLWM